MAKQVISLGDLVLDMIFPVAFPMQAGQHQNAAWRRVEPGGAANFMFAAQHMGLDVLPVGIVGADPFGAVILDLLRGEGIDTRFVGAAPGSTSTVVAVLTDQAAGEHLFLGCYGEGPEAAYPPELDAAIPQADALFFAGYTLAEQRSVGLAVRAVERARATGVLTFLDVGPFMADVPPDQVRWALANADTVLMTEDEIPLVSGAHRGDAAYDDLLAQGPGALIVKHGAGGCTVITADGQEHVPGYRVSVVDTVGAGDCFAGAYVAGRLAGLSLHDAARLANAMGAATVQKIGAGRNAPTCAEVRAVLDAAGEDLALPC